MSLPTKLLLIYTFLLNIILFFAMGYDKYCAKKQKWRLPEAYLFILALLGGSIGGLIVMKVFHHKTKKWYFYIIFVLAFCFQVALWILFFWKLKMWFLLPDATNFHAIIYAKIC